MNTLLPGSIRQFSVGWSKCIRSLFGSSMRYFYISLFGSSMRYFYVTVFRPSKMFMSMEVTVKNVKTAKNEVGSVFPLVNLLTYTYYNV